MSTSEIDEIVREFLVETTENLDQLDSDLVALERDPGSQELLASVFRTIHTVKGATGFLGFERLERLSHVAENLLSKLRDGELALTRARADALLEVVDEIRGLLAAIEATGAEDDRDLDALIATLTRLVDGGDEPAGRAAGQLSSLPAEEEDAGEKAATGLADGLATAGHDEERAKPGDHHRSASDRTVRVDVDLLDGLMRQVGELVLARNQITSHVGQVEDHQLHQTVQRLSLIVSELQEGVMKTRMQPIEQLWSKLPRVVRDLATQFSKEVALEMEGGETELDRSLLEAVKDPFVHLVRNAIDHGLELPDGRVAAGKPRAGVLSLKAFHEGGQVVLAVSDDGAGIDPGRLGERAVERGILAPERLAHMSERELTELIFRPGFSTAAVVTNVSGRGVGMDVVRTNIENIGGTVDVSTEPGAGTTFRIKIPLTLAIIPALLVGCRGQRFAIPQASLLEMVHLEGEQARTSIEFIDRAAFYRLRGRLLPLVRLDRLLGACEGSAYRGSISIVVLQADDTLFGLVVDDVHESQEIVVKPLGRHVKQIPLFAGATILGDGDVALILDVPGLASAAGVHEPDEIRPSRAERDALAPADREPGTASLVILRVGSERRVALPLAAVARLEEVPAEAIERAGGHPVMQYRGGLLPLVSLAEVIGEREGPSAGACDPAAIDVPGSRPVVVCADGDRLVGLIASEILDVVEGSFPLHASGSGSGVLGSTVVQGRVADLLDTRGAYERAAKGVLAHA